MNADTRDMVTAWMMTDQRCCIQLLLKSDAAKFNFIFNWN